MTTRGALRDALLETLDENANELYAFDGIDSTTDEEATENRATVVDMFIARLSEK